MPPWACRTTSTEKMRAAAPGHDDCAWEISLDGAPVRGRHARLGAGSIDAILRRHAYPRPVALLLGEALVLAALIGASLKQFHSLTIQAQGDGPVPLLVAQCGAGGTLRGYARLAPDAGQQLRGDAVMAPSQVLGRGALAVTLDPGQNMPQVQGIVSLEGESLSACVEAYFLESVQTPTRLRAAVAECLVRDAPACWRAGGMFLQRVAGDGARGDTQDDWARAQLLLDTITDAELTDPALPAERLVFQVFHEEGVRVAAPIALVDHCPCDGERLVAVLGRLSPPEIDDLRGADGQIHAVCQFCARDYAIAL